MANYLIDSSLKIKDLLDSIISNENAKNGNNDDMIKKEQKQLIMNKAELIDAIAKDAKLTKADAKKALDAFVNSTTKALKKGERVALVGFGSFSVARRSQRTGRNPQTGKPITIKAKNVVKFKAGSDLSSSVQ